MPTPNYIYLLLHLGVHDTHVPRRAHEVCRILQI